jgi:hypothetical protein
VPGLQSEKTYLIVTLMGGCNQKLDKHELRVKIINFTNNRFFVVTRPNRLMVGGSYSDVPCIRCVPRYFYGGVLELHLIFKKNQIDLKNNPHI